MTVPLRALIVDDERLAREKVRRLLEAEADVVIVGECGSGAEAVAVLRSASVDLVFLDIQMPGLSGFDVLREVGPSLMGRVVFVTAHDEFAVRAFDVQALDYLLKPFDSARFREALGRVRKRAAGELHAQLSALLEQIGARQTYAERMLVKGAGRLSFVRVDEIDWIEAADNYVRLHSGRDEHLLRETMNGVEARLDPQRFVRVHRSAIVNVNAVREVQPMFHGDYEVLLRTGKAVPVGRNYRERLLKTLGG
jgi:two-component system, LytTR family, response regulator